MPGTYLSFKCFVAELVVNIMEEYGPKRFIALVTDNARGMLNMRRLLVQKYPHLIEVR